MRILVTGASGFIGQYLTRHLVDHGHFVMAAGRRPVSASHEFVPLPEIEEADWRLLTERADCVIHLAAIAHTRGFDVERLRAVNRDGPINLAQSLSSGQHLIFMSSIRAQGEGDGQTPLDENALAIPVCDYGRMKLEAENEITRIHPDSCILRPVTVYGPDAKAGMRQLALLLESPLPLPFAGLEARRSYLSLQTLAAAVAFAVSKSLTGIYNLADPEPVALSGLARWYRLAQGREAHLFRLPERVLVAGSGLLGLQEFAKLAVKPMPVTPRKMTNAGFSFPWATSQQSIEAWARSRS